MKSAKSALTCCAVLSMGLLTSCVIYTDRSFSGATRIEREKHLIELHALKLYRADGDTWYPLGGPGVQKGFEPADCFLFEARLSSFEKPPVFAVLQLDILHNRSPLKFSRLVKLEETEMKIWYAASRYEIWVPSQPSPRDLPEEIPAGSYQIKIHYRFGDAEYDAEWNCVYKTKMKITRWHMPHS
jgi:hypothetical protein